MRALELYPAIDFINDIEQRTFTAIRFPYLFSRTVYGEVTKQQRLLAQDNAQR